MRVYKVEKASKDYPAQGIKKGETYYWWKFRYRGKQMSKSYPKRSQLTQSSYLATLYDLQDTISELSASDASDLESMRDDIVSSLEELKSNCEESLENIPEQLRDANAGSLLQERIEQLEGAISELEDVDCDYDEPSDEDIRSEAIEDLQLDEDDEESLQDRETEINDAIERLKADKMQEFVDEKIEEIQNVDLG